MPVRKPRPSPSSRRNPPPPAASPAGPDDLRRAARTAERARGRAEACAKLAALPIRHEHAAGIAVGDATHWVCVDSTPDGSDTVPEFPAHTAGLRQLVAWLRHCRVT